MHSTRGLQHDRGHMARGYPDHPMARRDGLWRGCNREVARMITERLCHLAMLLIVALLLLLISLFVH
jgi:hypothetical protein